MTIKQRYHDFLAWWLKGLPLLLPERWLSRLRHTPDRVTVEQQGQTLLFKRYDGHTGQVREERPVRLADSLEKRRINRWLDQHDKEFDLILLLPKDKQLKKHLSYPLSSEKDLRAILGFDMDKQTPFTHDKVYFDYLVTKRDVANGTIHLSLFVMLREVMEKRMDAIGFLDLKPAVATSSFDGTINEINFIPASKRRSHGSANRRLMRLALVTSLLLIVSLYVPLLRHDSIIDQFEKQVAQSRTLAMEAQALANKKATTLARADFLSNQYQRYTPSILLAQELTERLPDNTWLNRLDIRSGDIQMRGESAAAAAIIQLMEESAYFEEAQFRSPVTKNNATNKEKFHISAKVIAGAVK